MNSKLDKESLKILYLENKEFVLPFLAIGISFVLFFVFILPQVLSFPSKKASRDQEIIRLNEIKAAKQLLAGINESELDSQIKSSTTALPSDKDSGAILNAIIKAANLSNTQLDGYGFSGSIGAQSGKAGNKNPNLTFKISVNGDPIQVVKFVEELYKTSPVSEITNIDYAGGISELTVEFYYKAFTPNVTSNEILPRELTVKEKATLDKISSWNQSIPEEFENTDLTATESGRTSSSPF